MNKGLEAFWLEERFPPVPPVMGESKSISFHSSWKLWKGGMRDGVGTEDLWARSTSAVHLVLKVTGQLCTGHVPGQLSS